MSHLSFSRILAIDPSFKRTGIFFFDGRFQFSRLNGPKVLDTRYFALFKLSSDIADYAYHFSIMLKPDVIVVEYPPPVGQFTAGMWMLTSMIINRLDTKVYMAPPAVGRVLFKTRDWGKSDSVAVAKKFYSNRRLCGDEGDAFVMALPHLPYLVQQTTGMIRTYDYDSIRIQNGKRIEEKGGGWREFRVHT